MERSKNLKVFGILCLMVSIVAVSFSYASLTHTLKIKAATPNLTPGMIADEKWDVGLTNLSKPVKKGSAYEVSSPNFKSSNAIANFEVVFVYPGDSITYTFEIANKGTLDAAVSAVQTYKPTCVGSEKDCKSARKYIKYKLTYDDGSEIKVGDIFYSSDNEYLGFTSRKVKFTIEYSKDIPKDEIPTKNVTLKNIETIILFEQSYLG